MTVVLNCWNVYKKHDVQVTVKALGPLVVKKQRECKSSQAGCSTIKYEFIPLLINNKFIFICHCRHRISRSTPMNHKNYTQMDLMRLWGDMSTLTLLTYSWERSNLEVICSISEKGYLILTTNISLLWLKSYLKVNVNIGTQAWRIHLNINIKYAEKVITACQWLVTFKQRISSYCNGLYRIIIEICNQGWLKCLTSFLSWSINYYFLLVVSHMYELFCISCCSRRMINSTCSRCTWEDKGRLSPWCQCSQPVGVT